MHIQRCISGSRLFVKGGPGAYLPTVQGFPGLSCICPGVQGFSPFEEGKEMKKERKRRKKSVTQTWLDLNSVPLGCEESV